LRDSAESHMHNRGSTLSLSRPFCERVDLI
jgi:hypothetical protein